MSHKLSLGPATAERVGFPSWVADEQKKNMKKENKKTDKSTYQRYMDTNGAVHIAPLGPLCQQANTSIRRTTQDVTTHVLHKLAQSRAPKRVKVVCTVEKTECGQFIAI